MRAWKATSGEAVSQASGNYRAVICQLSDLVLGNHKPMGVILKASTVIHGVTAECSDAGALTVRASNGWASVLTVGTHAALDFLGAERKAEIVRWWKSVR